MGTFGKRAGVPPRISSSFQSPEHFRAAVSECRLDAKAFSASSELPSNSSSLHIESTRCKGATLETPQ
jgi:hypothetical protein